MATVAGVPFPTAAVRSAKSRVQMASTEPTLWGRAEAPRRRIVHTQMARSAAQKREHNCGPSPLRHQRTAGLSNPAWNVGASQYPARFTAATAPLLTESTVGMIE